MSMTSPFPTTRARMGDDVVTYPHIARRTRPDANGLRPITTGGIVIGYWTKLETGHFEGFDQNRERVAFGDTMATVAERVARLGHAHQAYVETARQGVFGTQAERWVRDAEATTVDEDSGVIIGWPEWNHGAPRAEVKLDGEVIGSVVQVNDRYVAQTPNGKQHGQGGMNQAVRTLVEHVIDQREIAAALPTCTEAINGHGGVCQAPLNDDGTCPGRKLHVTAMHARDRNDAIREALRQVRKAVEADRLADPDGEHELREPLGAARGALVATAIWARMDVPAELRSY